MKKIISFGINDLYHMHHCQAPRAMERVLAQFRQKRQVNYETFVLGIKIFTELANLDYDQREALFGSRFFGLHYTIDLADALNTEIGAASTRPFKPQHLFAVCPPNWKSYLYKSCYQAFVYEGDYPAEALDAFVKGPSAIDCGMFTQLSIWFGIRYMLGNDGFNQFVKKFLPNKFSFCITQINYNAISNPSNPCIGNPLFPLFDTRPPAGPHVAVSYFKNYRIYFIKHPGGFRIGENCIKIEDQHIIFSPKLKKSQGLSVEEIQTLLLNAFNEPQNSHDQDRLALFEEYSRYYPEERHSQFPYRYQEFIDLAKKHRTTVYKRSPECGRLEKKIYFDLSRLIALV